MAAKPTLLAVLLCATSFCAGASQVYRWVDPDGRVHFSDTPRPGAVPVDLKAAPGFGAAEADGSAAAGGDASNGAATSEIARTQLRSEACQRRREQLDSYLTAARIVERDNLGREKEYSQEERLELIEQTQRDVAELCGDD